MADSPRTRPSAPSPTDARRIQDEEAYPYIITQEIGKGSFATVYKGYHNKSRKAVAIKTVSRSILTHKLLENLESEISILKALTHKHITELKDIVKARNNIYLIMEFCSGGDLSKYIRHRGRIEGLEYTPGPGAAPQYWPHPKSGGLDPEVVRSFLGQLASALRFLRNKNLIHRDIKPQNLLLEPSDPSVDAPIPAGIPLLKIADFGFARSLPNAAMAETLCGSPLYMAPEILRYEKYDAKADLWSVGAVVYEMSVGKPPFRAQNHMELLKKIEHARGRVNFPDEVADKEAKQRAVSASPPRSVPKEKEVTVVPPDLKALIRMLLKRKPVERASFEDFFEAEAVKTQLDLLDGSKAARGASSPRQNIISIPPTSDLRRISTDRVDATNGDRKREKVARDVIEKDALPLEGTPYDPKLYVPQPYLKFRKVSADSEENVAGPSSQPNGRRQSSSRPVANGVHGPEVGRPRHPDLEEALSDAMGASKQEKEYVIVDPASATDAQAGWHKPASSRAISTPVRGAAAAAALTKQVGRLVIGATLGNGTPSSAPGPSPTFAQPQPSPKHPMSPTRPIPIQGRRVSTGTPSALGQQQTPPFATSYRRSSDQVNGLAQQPAPEPEPPTVNPVPMTFPPPQAAPASPPISSSPYGYDWQAARSQPSALARAINMASRKLFGSPTSQNQVPSSASPSSSDRDRSPRIVPTPVVEEEKESEVDSQAKEKEDSMLAEVEKIAQKAQVLKDFADLKYSKVPSKMSVDYARRKGESSNSADARRKAQMEAEQTATTSIALYMATMGFCQKGINELNRYCEENLAGSKSTSESIENPSGVDDAIIWFRDAFKGCFERSEALKAWLPEGHKDAQMFIDRVIYDHALALMRHAASKELLEENFPQVQKEYEKAMWLLYAIEDDVIQEGNPFRDQDVKTIAGFIDTTKTRLMRLRRRIDAAAAAQHQFPQQDPPSPRLDFVS